MSDHIWGLYNRQEVRTHAGLISHSCDRHDLDMTARNLNTVAHAPYTVEPAERDLVQIAKRRERPVELPVRESDIA